MEKEFNLKEMKEKLKIKVINRILNADWIKTKEDTLLCVERELLYLLNDLDKEFIKRLKKELIQENVWDDEHFGIIEKKIDKLAGNKLI